MVAVAVAVVVGVAVGVVVAVAVGVAVVVAVAVAVGLIQEVPMDQTSTTTEADVFAFLRSALAQMPVKGHLMVSLENRTNGGDNECRWTFYPDTTTTQFMSALSSSAGSLEELQRHTQEELSPQRRLQRQIEQAKARLAELEAQQRA